MERGDWAIQRVDECIVGCPRRFYSARNLGLYANRLVPVMATTAANLFCRGVQHCRSRRNQGDTEMADTPAYPYATHLDIKFDPLTLIDVSALGNALSRCIWGS
jgi:hypothetical protein